MSGSGNERNCGRLKRRTEDGKENLEFAPVYFCESGSACSSSKVNLYYNNFSEED